MSDDGDIVDRTAARDARTKARAQQDRQRRQWAREGYDPERHWTGANAKGAVSLVTGWLREEIESGRRLTRAEALPGWFAHMDLLEMVRRPRRVYEATP